MRRIPAMLRSIDGSIAVMSALAGTCVIGCMALAVDVGSLHLERRRLQSVADLAAVAAVSNLANAHAAVQSVLTANGVTATAQVETGRFTPDLGLPVANRYTPGAADPNAARVTLTARGTLYFARVIYGGEPPQIRVIATAAEENVAQFSIGTRLASVREGMLNDLFGDLLGTTVNLNLMDYNGLAGADIDLLQFMNALAGEIDMSSGTYDELLDADLTFGNVLDAAATVAGAAGANAAQIALNRLEMAPGGIYALEIDGRDLLDAGSLGKLSLGETPAGFQSKISLMDLVRSGVNAAGPNNQAQVSLGAGIPGLTSVILSVVIGELPQGMSWITLGPEGAEVYTAQTRVRAVVSAGPVTVAGVGVSLTVPFALDIAAGRARLAGISCGPNPAEDATVQLAVRPSIGGFHLGVPDDFADWVAFDPVAIQTAPIVTVAGIVGVSAQASAVAGNTQDIPTTFDANDIAIRKTKTVATSGALSSLIDSALSNLTVSARFLGFGLPLPGLLTGAENAVRSAIAPLVAAVEPVIESFLGSLDVGLGEADVRVYGVRCGAPALVM